MKSGESQLSDVGEEAAAAASDDTRPALGLDQATGPPPASSANAICQECGDVIAERTLTFCPSCGGRIGPDPLAGKVIEDRYEVLQRLGAGAMGAVYKVRHLRLDKLFAMKIIRQTLARQDEFAARFEQEAMSTSRLQHPNCIGVTDYGQSRDGQLYLVMEYLEGVSLGAVLGDPLPVSRALTITHQILLGLQHAHAAGVIHRDVKPDNVMLLPGPRGGDLVKVLDFGIAKLPLQKRKSDSRLTDAGVVFGTPEYMAPEQSLDSADVQACADLYAVGVMLWRMLTGRALFSAENSVELLHQKLSQEPPTLARACPGVFSAPLEALVARALARSPRHRYQSADEFLADLSAIESDPGGGLAIAAPSTGEPAGRGLLSAISTWFHGDGVKPRSWGDRARGLVTTGGGRIVATLALAVIALLVIAGSYLADATSASERGTAGDGSARSAGATRVPDAATQRRLDQARMMLARYAYREAALDLADLTRNQPRLARAHFLLGSAEIGRGRHAAGLAAFRRAIALEREYRKSARVLEEVAPLLAAKNSASRVAALAFLAEEIGEPALDHILGAATSNFADVRHAGVIAAEKLGAGDRVDRVTSLHQDLKSLPCKKLKERDVVAQLSAVDDPRVVSILRAARDARSGRWFNRRYRNACIRRAIITALKARR